MSENENKKGFAGLSSLESNVDPIISQAPVESKSETKSDTSSQTNAPPPISKVVPKHTYSPEMDFIKKYWLWILIALVLIYAFSSSDNNSSSSKPVSSSYTSSNLRESVPSYGAGAGHILNASEIYYCLAEAVRIEQNRETVNQYDSSAIARFNITIDDFNRRCSDYRYKESSMISANKALEANRYLIEAQGRARM